LQNFNVLYYKANSVCNWVALLALALWLWGKKAQSERKRLCTCWIRYWSSAATCQLAATGLSRRIKPSNSLYSTRTGLMDKMLFMFISLDH
jgi:hypothetical protein